MDLRIQGGGRVSWDKVREWHGHTNTTKCEIRQLVGSSHITQGNQLGAL